jgi:hypothetical protein
MTNLTNGELYTMLLHRLRKDRKGSVSPEEFESFLKWRNLDYYNKLIPRQGESANVDESLVPFMWYADPLDLTTISGEDMILLDKDATVPVSGPTYGVGKIINAWASSSDSDYSSKIEIDIVSSAEYRDRLNNAITGPSNEDPIGYLGNVSGVGTEGVLVVHGGSGFKTSYPYVLLDYYKYPAEPYFDYYNDASGNVTYLADTDPDTTHVLLSGEMARDGKTAGQTVTSASQDLEWGDDDAINILDMIVSDVSVALSDPNSFQASLLERKENS